MNSGAAFSQIRRVRDLERRCFFSARRRGDMLTSCQARSANTVSIRAASPLLTGR